MKTSEMEFEFPVLGFPVDQDFLGFRDRRALTTCGRFTIEKNLAVGTEFIDARLRRWVVRTARKVGNARPWFVRPFTYWLVPPLFRIEHELEALEPLSLDEVKDRIRVSMQAYPPEWSPDDELDTVIATDFADLAAAGSVAEIYERFQPDTFEPT